MATHILQEITNMAKNSAGLQVTHGGGMGTLFYLRVLEVVIQPDLVVSRESLMLLYYPWLRGCQLPMCKHTLGWLCVGMVCAVGGSEKRAFDSIAFSLVLALTLRNAWSLGN